LAGNQYDIFEDHGHLTAEEADLRADGVHSGDQIDDLTTMLERQGIAVSPQGELDSQRGINSDSGLSEDPRGVSPAEAMISVDLKRQTTHVLRTLGPREERVIKMRFGLEDGSERTLEEIGQSLQVTRERIRQIEARALRKLRLSSRARKLRGFAGLE
jgi:RNA polymerase sigma factor (sigma-70 family)